MLTTCYCTSYLEMVCRSVEAEEVIVPRQSVCLVYRIFVSESYDVFFVVECGLLKGFGKKILSYLTSLNGKPCVAVNDLTPEDFHILGKPLAGRTHMPTPNHIWDQFKLLQRVAGDAELVLFFDAYPATHKNTPVEVTMFKSINPSLGFSAGEDEEEHEFYTDNQWKVHTVCTTCLRMVNSEEKIRVKIRFRGENDDISSQADAVFPRSASIHTIMERAYLLFNESPVPSSFVAVLYDLHSKNQVVTRCGTAVEVLEVICCLASSSLCYIFD